MVRGGMPEIHVMVMRVVKDPSPLVIRNPDLSEESAKEECPTDPTSRTSRGRKIKTENLVMADLPGKKVDATLGKCWKARRPDVYRLRGRNYGPKGA